MVVYSKIKEGANVIMWLDVGSNYYEQCSTSKMSINKCISYRLVFLWSEINELNNISSLK